ncbi:MAG TPA: PIN domain-containing protein [Tepidisphaeraceae bacterium]|nr:PIN domain-containing protein [Tepidisphaeraceae bacterium]
MLDTNCFIQIVRSRPDAPQVQALLDGIPRARLFVTDFTVHSIGVVMARFKQVGGYTAFLSGLGVGQELAIVQVEFSRLNQIANACVTHALDFDDAYQYVAAELHGLKLVSLDADFDRTPNGRLTPTAALQSFMDEKK